MKNSEINKNILREIKGQNEYFERIISLFPFGYVSSFRENREINSDPSKSLPKNNSCLCIEKGSSSVVGYSQVDKLKDKLRIKVEAIKSASCTSTFEEERKSNSKRALRRAEKLRSIENTKKKSFRMTPNKNIKSLFESDEPLSNGQSSNYDIMNTKPSNLFSLEKDEADICKDLSGVDYGAITGHKYIPPSKNNKSLTNLTKKISLRRLLADAEAKRKKTL